MTDGPTGMDVMTWITQSINLKKKGEKIMIKMKRIVIRILKCLICFFTGGFANKKNGGDNAAC